MKRSFVAIVLLLTVGCTQTDQTASGSHALLQQEQQKMGRDLFVSAVELLKKTQDFSPRSDLRAVTDRFNQWLVTAQPPADWHLDPLVAKLPENLQKLPSLADLEAMKFSAADGQRLREAVWLRDIAQLTAGRETEPQRRAALLFDWTIRNIQLEAKPVSDKTPTLPWETLALGRGQAVDRAWIFALLARQAGLDVVLLATGDDPANVRLAALWDRGELYLFDTALGLPVPAAGGDGVATLAQAQTDDAILEQLSIDEFPYPLTADDLKQATVWIESSPLYFEQRARAVEERLVGGDRMVLSVDASALAAALEASRMAKRGELWPLPYLREQARAASDRPTYLVLDELLPTDATPGHLWRGRATQLMGHFSGENSATSYLQACRLSDAQIESVRLNPEQVIDPALAAEETAIFKRTLIKLKQDAGYWLGLISYERGSYDTAIDYFAQRTLAAFPDGPWTSGAHYNLARCYESLDRDGDAIAELRAAEGPQRAGNLLRARRLEASSH